MVTYTYFSSTLGGQGRRIVWGQEFKTNLGNITTLCLYQKFENQPVMVVCACSSRHTHEAEAGGLLEPRGSWLQWAMVALSWANQQDPISKYIRIILWKSTSYHYTVFMINEKSYLTICTNYPICIKIILGLYMHTHTHTHTSNLDRYSKMFYLWMGMKSNRSKLLLNLGTVTLSKTMDNKTNFTID